MEKDISCLVSEAVEAAGKGLLDDVRAFVAAHPAQIDAADWDGTTMLSCAAWHGQLETVKALLEMDASCDVMDDQHYTPISAAVTCGEDDVACLLAQKTTPVLVEEAIKMAVNMHRDDLGQRLSDILQMRWVTEIDTPQNDRVRRLMEKQPCYNPLRKNRPCP